MLNAINFYSADGIESTLALLKSEIGDYLTKNEIFSAI